jgi:hypothetical protein
MDELAQVDHGLAQRLTLLVYNDIEAVHDHLVAVFGFGPGTMTRWVWPGRTRRATRRGRCGLDASTIS